MSKRSLRKFSIEFKAGLLERVERGERVRAVAREAGVARQLIEDWRKAFRAYGLAGLNRKSGAETGVESAAIRVPCDGRTGVRGRRPARRRERG